MKYYWKIALLLGFAGVDQGSKYLMNNDYMDLPYKITDFFRFVLVHNDGIAFSLKLKKELILILTAVVLVGLLFMFFQKFASKTKAIGLALVLGGALGNHNLFVLCMIGFLLASTGCGLATNLSMLVGFRLMQGFVMGPMEGLSAVFLLQAFPPHQRGLALGFRMLGASIGQNSSSLKPYSVRSLNGLVPNWAKPIASNPADAKIALSKLAFSKFCSLSCFTEL